MKKSIQYDYHVFAWLRTQPKAMHLIMKYLYNKKRGV